MTPGEPLFCNFCGRSYDGKLCPRLHPNTRVAQVCSQCGSQDLSIPQPQATWWLSPALWLTRTLPVLPLLIVSFQLSVTIVQVVVSRDQLPFDQVTRLGLLLLSLAITWRLYIQFAWFMRTAFGRGIRPVRKSGSTHR
jgi:hypothetical protein